MKLSEFARNINDLMEERPETKDFDVVTSKDDEGNGFSLVNFTPTVGKYDNEDKEFQDEITPNAVCIN